MQVASAGAEEACRDLVEMGTYSIKRALEVAQVHKARKRLAGLFSGRLEAKYRREFTAPTTPSTAFRDGALAL